MREGARSKISAAYSGDHEKRLVRVFLGVACFRRSGTLAYHPRRRSAAPSVHAACVPPPAEITITNADCVRNWAAEDKRLSLATLSSCGKFFLRG
jgi:hypothetical protein